MNKDDEYIKKSIQTLLTDKTKVSMSISEIFSTAIQALDCIKSSISKDEYMLVLGYIISYCTALSKYIDRPKFSA